MSESRPALWVRSFVFWSITVVLAVVGYGYWKQVTAAKMAPLVAAKPKGEMRVSRAVVDEANYALDLLAVGTVAADEAIDVSANVTETVTALHFQDGQKVKKGDLLVELSATEEEAALSAARSQLTEHEREISRLENLVKAGAAPEARLEERRTLAEVAKQNIHEAESRLADRRISAPFDGWLGLRRISVGALVSPGTVIVSLDKIDQVKVDFSVPETYLDEVVKGTEIEARAEVEKSRVFKGKVEHLDSRLDPVTRAMVARALVPNPDLALKPGMLVMVTIHVQPRSSLSIPERALVPIGQKNYVFLLQEELVKRVEIQTGRRKPGFVEVTKGLKKGQAIVADGLVGLQDGMKVLVTGDFQAPTAAFDPEAMSGPKSSQ